MPARQPAPAPLNVVEDFVNTYEIDGADRYERIPTPEALEEWLRERELLDEASGGLAEEDRAVAVRVREDLRALLLANNGEPSDEDAVARLNDAGRRALVAVRLTDPGHAQLEPHASGIDAAIARLLAIVFQAMKEGAWARLKACRNDECLWVFYDSSKNHSATWCSMRVCGNRMKARAYRRRHAEDHA